jgi:hypothetical protein
VAAHPGETPPLRRSAAADARTRRVTPREYTQPHPGA